MKPLNQNELFENLKGFLKTRGIELQQGSYTRGIQKSCSLLSDAINLGQQGVDRAKVKIDQKLDQMRQVVHEKTAPRKPKAATAEPQAPPTQASAQSKSAPPKTRARKGRKPSGPA